MKLINTAAALAIFASSSAFAVPVTFFDTINNGQSNFNSTIIATGSTVQSNTLAGLTSGTSWDQGAFVITNVDGASSGVYSGAQDGTTGQMIGVNPQGSGIDPANYKDSGLTFTFSSAINAIGFEVGDWGTCCTPSSLFMQFDGVATQLVGTANSYSDNPAKAAGLAKDGIFVGAIDDTSTFTSVTFWGNGVGEFLTAGGTIKWANVEIDSVTPVPAPAPLGLLGLAFVGLAISRRRKKSA